MSPAQNAGKYAVAVNTAAPPVTAPDFRAYPASVVMAFVESTMVSSASLYSPNLNSSPLSLAYAVMETRVQSIGGE